MTISREKGEQTLLEAGMTPKIIDEGDTSYFFIEKNICWPKLFCSIKQLPDYKEALEVIPHLRLLEKLITNRNPTLFPIECEGKQGFAIELENMQNHPRLDRELKFMFYIISHYISQLIDNFNN